MRYIAKGYKLYTRKIQEGAIHNNYTSALGDAMEMLKSGEYKVIVILSDSEGEDHLNNAGKFFLHRVIK